MCKNIDNQIKELFEKNVPMKVIARTVHKKSVYVQGVIKKKNLKRPSILKRFKRYCIRCNKEILRSDVYKYCSRKCFIEYEYGLYIKKWLAGEIEGSTRDESVSNHMRRWLFEKNNNKCEKCGWNKKKSCNRKDTLNC